MANFLTALAFLVNITLTVLGWVMVVRAVISWFSPDPFNPLVQFLHRVTEPILEPIRRLLPMMAIDISPMIAIFAIMFLQQFLVRSLYDLAIRLQ